MKLSELLKLLPGPAALTGAVLEKPDGKRLKAYAPFNLGPNGCSEWRVIERPPMYQNPAARYCAFCKEPLYKGYSSKRGLTDGWCPNHGEAAKVLHSTWSTPKMPPDYVDTTRGSEVPKQVAPKPITETLAVPPDQLLKQHGFKDRAEFRRLAGLP